MEDEARINFSAEFLEENTWPTIEQAFRGLLTSEGFGEAAISWILDKVKRSYLAIQKMHKGQIAIAASSRADVECVGRDLVAFFHDSMTLALFEIFHLAKELYIAKFPAPSPGAHPRLRLISGAGSTSSKTENPDV